MKKIAIAAALTCAALPGVASAANVTAEVSLQGSGVLKAHSDSSMPNFDPSVEASLSAWNGTAWASADLQSGSLRGYANTVGTFTGASFNVGFQDLFTFDIADASSDTLTLLYLAIDFDAATYSDYGINFRTDIGSSHSNSIDSIAFSHGNFRHTSFNPVADVDEYVAYSARDNIYAAGAVHYLLPFEVRGANPIVALSSQVFASGNFNGFADFSNSAHLRFVLPQNVTFTSQSGVGLTGAVGAVPEPSTWAMLIVGFGAVGLTMRKKSRKDTTLAGA